jgi:hypothetical protein
LRVAFVRFNEITVCGYRRYAFDGEIGGVVQDTVKIVGAELCLGEGEESDEEVIPGEGVRWWW